MVESLITLADPGSLLFMDPSLQGLFTWFKNEAKIVLFMVLLAALIVTIVKRAWVSAVAVLVGLALIGIFILEPEALLKLSSWLSSKLSI